MDLVIHSVKIQVIEPHMLGSEKEPALLFIHGAGLNASIWDAQANHFRGKHLVYRLELPGHGGSESDSSDEGEITAYATWVRQVIERLFQSVAYALVGHSMGGAIALELGTKPLRGLHSLVLVGTGAKLGVTPIVFQMLKENRDAFFETIDRVGFSANTSRNVRDRVIELIKNCVPRVISKDFQACDRFDIRERLKNILLPTLIVCGEEDLLTPVKYSRYLHEMISASSLAIIPGAGHMIMAEQPERLNRAIEAFLAQPI
jgi:pimeloyl-ACP methyl ester carboxylesterase